MPACDGILDKDTSLETAVENVKENLMIKNNPIKHHYIPRFLLRPFTFEKGHVFYCDKKKRETSVKDIANIFMAQNLYRDIMHHPEEPTKIEEDFAKYENRVASIIKRFMESDEILISAEEEEELKLFFAIMGFRAERVKEAFGSNLKTENRIFYGEYLRGNEDYTDLWKRNIEAIVNCRSIKEVLENPLIDKPIKVLMKRDTVGIFGTYFTVVQCDETEEFILGDSYPADVYGEKLTGSRLTMYSIFPISPRRVILQVAYGVLYAPQGSLGLKKKSYFQRPKLQQDQNIMKIHVGKVSETDVKMINKIIFDAAAKGVIMRSKREIGELL